MLPVQSGAELPGGGECHVPLPFKKYKPKINKYLQRNMLNAKYEEFAQREPWQSWLMRVLCLGLQSLEFDSPRRLFSFPIWDISAL